MMTLEKTIYNADFGDWLKSSREAKGWSMRRLEAESDVTQAYISSLESAKRLPTKNMVERLAKALSRDMDADTALQFVSRGMNAAGFLSATNNEFADLDPDERRLVASYRNAPIRRKKAFIDILEDEGKTPDDQLPPGQFSTK